MTISKRSGFLLVALLLGLSPTVVQVVVGTPSGSLDLPSTIDELNYTLASTPQFENAFLGSLTNLTDPIIDSLSNFTGAIGTAINFTGTPIIGSLSNFTGVPGLNLSNILGPLNNLTGTVETALHNLTGPASDLTIATNVTVTVTLNPAAAGTAPNLKILSSFPSSVSIVPLGTTEVSFHIFSVEGSSLRSVPVTFMVPMNSYLDTPISSSAEVTLDVSPGSLLSVVGLATEINRLFFGVSWQTFPQLTSVLISKILPNSSVLLHTISIPPLICTLFNPPKLP